MILVGATTAAWKCRDGQELRWLAHAEAMREASPVPLEFFCAIQLEAGYPSVHDYNDDFRDLTDRLNQVGKLRDDAALVGGRWWTFLMDGWRQDSRHRLIGITTGRNLVREHALRDTDATHVLFLDTDVEPDPDCVPKLLELDHPVVGGDVPSYCLTGPQVCGHRIRLDQHASTCDLPSPFPVQEHWNTAGFLLVRRDALAEVAWRWDPTTVPPLTDDPCFARDVERAGFGRTWVRKDVVGRHVPLVPVEAR